MAWAWPVALSDEIILSCRTLPLSSLLIEGGENGTGINKRHFKLVTIQTNTLKSVKKKDKNIKILVQYLQEAMVLALLAYM